MNRRKSTLLFIATMLLALIGVIYLASHFILLGSFVALEERDMRANVERVLNAINIQMDSVATIASGYSMWDDAYRFVIDGNQEFIDLNMMDTTFTDYNVNIIIYLNNDLEVVYEKAVDLDTGTEAPVPASIYEHLTAGSPFLDLPDTESMVNGIISLPEGELILTSQPIVTSEGSGPINGIQIWGRYLDESFFEQLSETTNFTVTTQRYPDESWPEDFKQATLYLDSENVIFVEPLDNVDIVAGYTTLNDIYGQPAMMLRVDTQRAIYTQGQASINYFFLAMVISSIVLAGLAQSRVTLQQENIELEQRVEERTAELSRANTQLRTEIAERKRAEEELEKARDAAVEALQLKTKIMANVSHEARTPLTTIVLRTELMQRGRYGHISSDQRRVLDTILANARQMLGFFNNLMAESQLNNDRIVLFKTAFSPAELLKDVSEIMSLRAEQKGLQLRVETGERVPETLIGDADQLMLIITNLLDNAIKFTEHGKLTVIIDRPDETHWTLRVIDTGRGIPTSAQQRIFEPFWQIDGSITREISRGVGLGLSIVQQLTALMDGEITVNSEVGQGATFTITFPLTEAQGET